MKTFLHKLFLAFGCFCMGAWIWCWISLSISQRRLTTPVEALDNFLATEDRVMEKAAGGNK